MSRSIRSALARYFDVQSKVASKRPFNPYAAATDSVLFSSAIEPVPQPGHLLASPAGDTNAVNQPGTPLGKQTVLTTTTTLPMPVRGTSPKSAVISTADARIEGPPKMYSAFTKTFGTHTPLAVPALRPINTGKGALPASD